MIPPIRHQPVPIECAAPPRPAPLPHARPGPAPRIGPDSARPVATTPPSPYADAMFVKLVAFNFD